MPGIGCLRTHRRNMVIYIDNTLTFLHGGMACCGHAPRCRHASRAVSFASAITYPKLITSPDEKDKLQNCNHVRRSNVATVPRQVLRRIPSAVKNRAGEEYLLSWSVLVECRACDKPEPLSEVRLSSNSGVQDDH